MKSILIFTMIMLQLSCSTYLAVDNSKGNNENNKLDIIDAVVLDAEIASDLVAAVADDIKDKVSASKKKSYHSEPNIACNVKTQGKNDMKLLSR